MVQEKSRSSMTETGANEVKEEAGETILDFLWSGEAQAASTPQETNFVPGYAEPLKEPEPAPVPLAQPVSHAQPVKSVSGSKPLPQGLKDALEQYSTWLNTWAGQA